MKKVKVSIMVLGIVLLGACKKEKQDDLKKDITHCSDCVHFDTSKINLNVTKGTKYDGVHFYESHNIRFDEEYEDITSQNQPSSPILTMQLGSVSGWSSQHNSNFKNNIFVTADNNVRLDFSSIAYKSKKIEFDVSSLPLAKPANAFKVNGTNSATVPAGIIVDYQQLTNGYHIVITGEVNSLIWYGFEVAYDNLCVSKHQPEPVVIKCIDFNDTLFQQNVNQSQVAFKDTVYHKNGVDFRYAYKDFNGLNLMGDFGSRVLVGSGFESSNSNFAGNIFVLGDVEVELSLFDKGKSKKVEFDVSLVAPPTQVNFFRVNGLNNTTKPTGVTYTYKQLSNGLHVTIEGPIDVLYWRGWETAYDNLCITL